MSYNYEVGENTSHIYVAIVHKKLAIKITSLMQFSQHEEAYTVFISSVGGLYEYYESNNIIVGSLELMHHPTVLLHKVYRIS